EDLEPLARRVMTHLKLSQPRDVLRFVYQQPTPVNEIAACAPMMLEAFEREGDNRFVMATLQRAATSLTSLVIQLHHSLDNTELPIVFSGSILSGNNVLS